MCEGVTELLPVQQLQKVLSKDHFNGIGLLKERIGNIPATTKKVPVCYYRLTLSGKRVDEEEHQSGQLKEVPRCRNTSS